MMKRFFLKALVAMVVALAWPAQAQAAVYTWSKYDLTFDVPDHGFVTHSSSTRFEVQWSEMMLTIQLYNKDKSDEKFIKDNLERKALGYSMYDTKPGKMKVKGFKTLLVEGTMPDGSRALIVDLIADKQNLIVEVTVNYLFGNREVVDDIIKSFAIGKKPEEIKEKKHKQKVQSKEDAEKQEQQQREEEEKRDRARNRRTFEA